MTVVRIALLCIVLSSAFPSYSQSSSRASVSADAPLRLVQTLEMPRTVKGNFDHFGIDLKRNRLFATPEDFKAVLVFDLGTGKLIQLKIATKQLISNQSKLRQPSDSGMQAARRPHRHASAPVRVEVGVQGIERADGDVPT